MNVEKGRREMSLAIITAKQVAELFIMIAAGFVLKKTNMFGSDGKKIMSDLLIKFVVPCMILNSYIGSYDDSVLGNVGLAFVYSIVLCTAGIAITLAISKLVCEGDKGIFRFACSFSNAAYMGFPLIRALFGEEGILYASAYVTVFNILLWTVGCVFFADRLSLRSLMKNLMTCPPILAVAAGLLIYILRVQIPEILAEPISSIGAMTTPLSMLITGATMAEAGVFSLVKDKRVYFAAVIRLAVIPAAGLLLFRLVGFLGMAAQTALILEACPAAAITTLFAIQHNMDEGYAAGIVAISTIFSIVTLPLFVFICSC